MAEDDVDTVVQVNSLALDQTPLQTLCDAFFLVILETCDKFLLPIRATDVHFLSRLLCHCDHPLAQARRRQSAQPISSPPTNRQSKYLA